MFFSDLQLENALCPIVRAELPPPSNVTVTSAEQLAKAFFSMAVTKLGITSPVKPTQPLKAEAPIVVTPAGTV